MMAVMQSSRKRMIIGKKRRADSIYVHLRSRDESPYLLQDIDVEGSDKVGLRALVSAALTAVSSAACCAVVNG